MSLSMVRAELQKMLARTEAGERGQQDPYALGYVKGHETAITEAIKLIDREIEEEARAVR